MRHGRAGRPAGRPAALRAGLLAGLLAGAGCARLGGAAVLSPAERLAATQADERIRAEVEARLAAEPSIGPGRVRVEVNAGEVQLHGAVAGLGALRCAETNAGLTPGVVLVIDHLVLRPGSATAACRAPRRWTPGG